jgi:hypothetical protein
VPEGGPNYYSDVDGK